jgi:hypothetical protein
LSTRVTAVWEPTLAPLGSNVARFRSSDTTVGERATVAKAGVVSFVGTPSGKLTSVILSSFWLAMMPSAVP